LRCSPFDWRLSGDDAFGGGRIMPLLNVLEVRDQLTKVTAVHIDRLLPCQASRISLYRSCRSRKQTS
jgi:hypothetical protein